MGDLGKEIKSKFDNEWVNGYYTLSGAPGSPEIVTDADEFQNSIAFLGFRRRGLAVVCGRFLILGPKGRVERGDRPKTDI